MTHPMIGTFRVETAGAVFLAGPSVPFVFRLHHSGRCRDRQDRMVRPARVHLISG